MTAVAYALIACAAIGYAGLLTWLTYRDRAEKRASEAARAVPGPVPPDAELANRVGELESKVNAMALQNGLRLAKRGTGAG